MAREVPGVARRLRRPGWGDPRLVVGLLIVLVSVVAGARLFAAMDDSRPVYAAARPLLPGQEVAASDLEVVDVAGGVPVERYLDATQQLQPGTYALRRVGAGELVPASALGTAREATDKAVTLPVDPATVTSLSAGAVVDVWVSRRDREAAGERYTDPELLLERAVVESVPDLDGALGVGVGRASVQVVVPADEVSAAIAAVDQGARITLVPAPGRAGGAP